MANKKATYDDVENVYIEKNKAVDAKVEADSAAYSAQREDIGDESMSTLQQLYVQNERNKLTRAQAARAAGLTGGAVESAAIADRANYMKSRAETLINRDKQLAQVDIAEAQAKNQAEIDKADNNTQMEIGRLSYLQDQENQKRSDAWNFLNKGIYDQNTAATLGVDQGVVQQYAEIAQQEQNSAMEDGAWEFIRQGIYTDEIGKSLSRWSAEVLKLLAQRYKEAAND